MTSESSEKLVYVVDDDEEQLAVLRMLLTGAGFAVVTESDADKVLAGARELRPDVMLLDVMLPSRSGVDGFALCAELKNDPASAATRIIILSAIAQGIGAHNDKLKAQVGADDFLMKPYDPEALINRIRELAS